MDSLHPGRAPALAGGMLALLAAALFGLSTPLVQTLGRGLGPFATAALLYAGAAVAGALLRKPAAREARLTRSDVPRLASLAFFGAVVGPVALAWGLQRASGAGASLMLTLEALFTAVLARLLYGESMGRRVWLAMALLLVGGVAYDRLNGGFSPLAEGRVDHDLTDQWQVGARARYALETNNTDNKALDLGADVIYKF